jgi:hypothetical protein
MADRSHLEPDRGDDTGVEPSQRSGTGTPRWVKVSGVVALLLVLLVVVLLLFGGGSHGPGRHVDGGSNDPASHTRPAGGHE